MAVENNKTKNLADYRIDKVHCRFFDEGNMPVIDAKDPKVIRTGDWLMLKRTLRTLNI